MYWNIHEMDIREEGQDEINQLTTILLDANRIEDLRRAAKDKDFQKSLLREYKIGQYGEAGL